MQDRGLRVAFRMNGDENERLDELVKRTGWSRSEAMRFSLNFTHMIISTMPAETIDAVISSTIPQPIEE